MERAGAAIRRLLRISLLVFGVVGTCFFVSLFMASWISDRFVSNVAREVIRLRVEAGVSEKIDDLGARYLIDKATELAGKDEKMAALFRNEVTAKLAAGSSELIGRMENWSCECRKGFSKFIADMITTGAGLLDVEHAKLKEFVRLKYLEVETRLTREFRIFTATNAFACLLILICAVVKRGAGIHLLPPAFALMIATVTSAAIYLFSQNWLHTILFNDYLGFAYVAYFAALFLWLCDILLNQARVTSGIINAVAGAVGGVLHVSPC